MDYGIIIAGDGYAYTSYAYQDGAGNMHLRLLQVGTSGASNKIEVREWAPGTSIDIGEGDMRVDMITNADQGVLISWEAPVFSPSSLSTTWDRNMAITTGTSFSIINGSVIPGQQSDLVPVLQAQDGSFVGIARPSGWTPYMVSFDQTGNVRWVVPNDQPQIATADGGVIGQSGITYDANGNATGMMSLYTYSWRGYAYRDGDLDQLAWLPPSLALGFWPIMGANESDNGTAALRAPTTLVITKSFGKTPKDCYSSIGNTQANSYAERDITYNVADKHGRPMLQGMQISERLTPSSGTSCPRPQTIQNGVCVGDVPQTNYYPDALSANPQTGQSQYTQRFWVTTPPSTQGYAAFDGLIPQIDAYQSGGPSPSNSLNATQFVISVNGNTGLNPDGTPIRSCN